MGGFLIAEARALLQVASPEQAMILLPFKRCAQLIWLASRVRRTRAQPGEKLDVYSSGLNWGRRGRGG